MGLRLRLVEVEDVIASLQKDFPSPLHESLAKSRTAAGAQYDFLVVVPHHLYGIKSMHLPHCRLRPLPKVHTAAQLGTPSTGVLS